jgi:hypothetical protein
MDDDNIVVSILMILLDPEGEDVLVDIHLLTYFVGQWFGIYPQRMDALH